MLSTIVYTKTNRINMCETLRATAIALRNQKRQFHAREIVALLKEQGVEVPENKVRNLLSYSGAGYTGKPRKSQFWMLNKLDAGMYEWKKYQYDPQADIGHMIVEVQ